MIVVPATEGDKPRFEEFALYLKNRQRAGVCTLSDGCLLLLAPLEQDNLQLRCVVVKGRKSARSPGSILASDVTAIRIEGAAPVPVRASQTEPQTHSGSELPPSTTEVAPKPPRKRSRSRNRKRATPDESNDESAEEATKVNQVEVPAAPKSLVLLRDLPRLERATFTAQLRQEFEAFNQLHYDVLRQWSSEDPNLDS